MAPPMSAPKKSSRRSRKARTEVSSSSSEASSDSEGSISSPEPRKKYAPASKQAKKAGESASPSPAEETPSFSTPAPRPDNEQAFESFYLRQAATEFSDDLDKLRSTSDFKGQSSVELLIGALKQGGACFSKDERNRIGSGGAGVTDIQR